MEYRKRSLSKMSVIRKRKGPDIDLQELYNDQFATNMDDIGPKIMKY